MHPLGRSSLVNVLASTLLPALVLPALVLPALVLPALMLAALVLAGAAQAQAVPGSLRPALFQSSLPSPMFGPGQQCRVAIRAAERAAGIPNQLMAAIGRIESGRREADGTVNPWPWSINVEGEDHVYETKAEVVAAVKAFQSQGMHSIDVGCMQVNLLHHPDAFATLEQAFDPVANAQYAAKFLVQLHEETGTWETATAWYHSATPDLGAEYQRRVMAVWPEEQKRPDAVAPPPPTTTYASAFANGFAGGFHGGFSNGFAAGFAAPAGRSAGSFVVSNRADSARIVPLPSGASGRGLAAYRAAPIVVVTRPGGAMLPFTPGTTPRDAGKPG